MEILSVNQIASLEKIQWFYTGIKLGLRDMDLGIEERKDKLKATFSS
jgi:hypothetical protein